MCPKHVEQIISAIKHSIASSCFLLYAYNTIHGQTCIKYTNCKLCTDKHASNIQIVNCNWHVQWYMCDWMDEQINQTILNTNFTLWWLQLNFSVLSLANNLPRQMWVQATRVQIQVAACVPSQICSEPNPGLMNIVMHYQPLYNLLICNLSELMFSTLRAHASNSIALLDKTKCSYILSWLSDCRFVDRTDRKSVNKTTKLITLTCLCKTKSMNERNTCLSAIWGLNFLQQTNVTSVL